MIATQDAEEIALTATGFPFQFNRTLLGLGGQFGDCSQVFKLICLQFLRFVHFGNDGFKRVAVRTNKVHSRLTTQSEQVERVFHAFAGEFLRETVLSDSFQIVCKFNGSGIYTILAMHIDA